MPTGLRSSVIVLALCALIGGAEAAGPASTWSDPPARKAGAASTETVVPKPSPPAMTERRPEPHRGMAVTRRTRIVARRAPAPSQIAVRAERRPLIPARHPMAMVRRVAPHPPFAVAAYPRYRAVDYPPDDEDARLERLGSAVHSGYLVMRRRTVEYSDGRVIRVYRPADEGDGD